MSAPTQDTVQTACRQRRYTPPLASRYQARKSGKMSEREFLAIRPDDGAPRRADVRILLPPCLKQALTRAVVDFVDQLHIELAVRLPVAEGQRQGAALRDSASSRRVFAS